MIDYCVGLIKQKSEETRYRNYVADSLRIITENTAKEVGGSYIVDRFAKEKKKEKKHERSAKEIISDISNKLDMIGKM